MFVCVYSFGLFRFSGIDGPRLSHKNMLLFICRHIFGEAGWRINDLVRFALIKCLSKMAAVAAAAPNADRPRNVIALHVL